MKAGRREDSDDGSGEITGAMCIAASDPSIPSRLPAFM
jgi:hypothetical protein